MRSLRDSDLTIKDMKNILLWYGRMNTQHEDLTTSDNKTHIKIQAMLIYEEENEAKENERFDRFK